MKLKVYASHKLGTNEELDTKKSVITVAQGENQSASISAYGGYYFKPSYAKEINHDKFMLSSGQGGGIKVLKNCSFTLSALVTFVWDSTAAGQYDCIVRRNRGGVITELAHSFCNKLTSELAHIAIPDFVVEDALVNDIYTMYFSSSAAITLKTYGNTGYAITYMTAREG